jgi:hypothetical protein
MCMRPPAARDSSVDTSQQKHFAKICRCSRYWVVFCCDGHGTGGAAALLMVATNTALPGYADAHLS